MGIVDCRMGVTAALLLQAVNLPLSLAFSPIASCNVRPSASAIAPSSQLYSVAPKEEEKVLRQEIAEKNSKIENEGEFGVLDGNIPEEVEQSDEVTVPTGTTLKAQIQRATKPRAYPLFLLEKGTGLLEEFVFKTFGSSGSEDIYINGKIPEKEKIVVLGTGWGAAAFLKDVDMSKYDVTVISPRNFFLFTPMLAGAATGTVEYRSITEPVRDISKKANFLEATATNIDPKTNSITCESVICEGTNCKINDFTVEYDRLIVTVGAQTNTFGIPGVREHCAFLKQVEDARRIRTSIVNLFERANIPSLTDEERKAILTFAVIGAGPTGIEFAAELRDFVENDGPKYYPNLLKFVRIKVIEASSTVLAPFDKSLQNEAIRQLTSAPKFRDPAVTNLLPEQFKLTELLLDSGVKEVTDEKILLSDGSEIPYGLAVWAAGNGPLPITLNLIDALGNGGSEQTEGQAIARGRLATDPWLRVLGGEGKIFSYGDCSCIVDGQLPATAQVASQQGEYLAKLISRGYNMSPGIDPEEGILMPPTPDPSVEKSISEKISSFAIQNDEIAAPFQFLNLGILAYTGGGSALAQLQVAPDGEPVKGTGKVGFGLWRSVYLTKQVSLRNRVLVLLDWLKAQAFGRDITRV
mmetsp:Transcript_39424/g.80877  ORF Transcript_39424/g.80877 Transcript_39424/m.80877 type:complete len:637 (+) Transcript_39424:94-2004(+)